MIYTTLALQKSDDGAYRIVDSTGKDVTKIIAKILKVEAKPSGYDDGSWLPIQTIVHNGEGVIRPLSKEQIDGIVGNISGEFTKAKEEISKAWMTVNEARAAQEYRDAVWANARDAQGLPKVVKKEDKPERILTAEQFQKIEDSKTSTVLLQREKNRLVLRISEINIITNGTGASSVEEYKNLTSERAKLTDRIREIEYELREREYASRAVVFENRQDFWGLTDAEYDEIVAIARDSVRGPCVQESWSLRLKTRTKVSFTVKRIDRGTVSVELTFSSPTSK